MRSKFSIRRRDNFSSGVTLGKYALVILRRLNNNISRISYHKAPYPYSIKIPDLARLLFSHKVSGEANSLIPNLEKPTGYPVVRHEKNSSKGERHARKAKIYQIWHRNESLFLSMLFWIITLGISARRPGGAAKIEIQFSRSKQPYKVMYYG